MNNQLALQQSLNSRQAILRRAGINVGIFVFLLVLNNAIFADPYSVFTVVMTLSIVVSIGHAAYQLKQLKETQNRTPGQGVSMPRYMQEPQDQEYNNPPVYLQPKANTFDSPLPY